MKFTKGDLQVQKLHRDNKKMAGDKKWILLNVGGTYFMTTRSTLARQVPSGSPLYGIANNSTNIEWDRDERGAYRIDRDPVYFQSVLNFLRHGHLVVDRNIPEEAILIEAEYFNLPELARQAREKINDRQESLGFFQRCQPLQQPYPQVQAQGQARLLFKHHEMLSSYVNHMLSSSYDP